MQYVLAFDAGTGSGRALLFNFEARVVASASREWAFPVLSEFPGSAVFETENSWKLLCECVHEVLRSSGVNPTDIAAVTASSMREGFVLYDQNLKEIWACPNIDARASKQAAGLIEKGLDKLIYETGGDCLALTMPPRLQWLAENQPVTFNQARHVSMLSDWVLFRLSGVLCTDPSAGSSSGLFDLQTHSWSAKLIETLNLPPIFPPIYPSGTVLRCVSSKAAEATGLNPKTLVVLGGADTQLGLIGSSGPGGSALTVVGGTFWQTALVTPRPQLDPCRRLRTLRHVLPGYWMTEGIGFLNGLAMRWVRDTVCADIAARAAQTKTDPYRLMEQLSEQAPPGCDGVYALVSDVMNAKCWLQAPITFCGLNLTKPGHIGDAGRALLIRATQESAVYTAREHWEILREMSGCGKDPDSITFCGGAAKGRLWPQLVADIFNLPVKVPKVTEATSLGSAFCALVGLKVFTNLPEAAAALVQWDRAFEPGPKRAEAYTSSRRTYAALQRNLVELVNNGTLPAAWRAPGI